MPKYALTRRRWRHWRIVQLVVVVLELELRVGAEAEVALKIIGVAAGVGVVYIASTVVRNVFFTHAFALLRRPRGACICASASA